MWIVYDKGQYEVGIIILDVIFFLAHALETNSIAKPKHKKYSRQYKLKINQYFGVKLFMKMLVVVLATTAKSYAKATQYSARFLDLLKDRQLTTDLTVQTNENYRRTSDKSLGGNTKCYCAS